MLASDTMTTVFESANIWSVVSLILQIYALLSFLHFLFIQWKENWLGKILISLVLEENSELKESNKERIPFNLLFTLIMVSLTFNYYLGIKFSSDRWWLLLISECLDSSNNLVVEIVF